MSNAADLDALRRDDPDLLSQEAYKHFQLDMLVQEIRTNPRMLGHDPVTMRHACELYADPRARLQIEIVLREQKLFPPDVWAACFAPHPVPQRRAARETRVHPEAQPLSVVETVEALTMLQEQWHATITGAVRHGLEHPTWYLRIGERTVELGSTRQLQDQTHVRGVVFDATGHIIPWVPGSHKAQWDSMLKALGRVAILIDTPDLTRVGQASELVLCYLESQYYSLANDFDTDEWETCARKNLPFMTEGRIYLHARHFHGHYVHLLAPGVSYQQCLEYLHALDARNVQVTVNTSPRTTRSYWRLPMNWLETIIRPMEKAAHND